jgi:hypothetical protein
MFWLKQRERGLVEGEPTKRRGKDQKIERTLKAFKITITSEIVLI